jgi:hypothetical protein
MPVFSSTKLGAWCHKRPHSWLNLQGQGCHMRTRSKSAHAASLKQQHRNPPAAHFVNLLVSGLDH